MRTLPNPFFRNVPEYGDLYVEEIIVDYVYPILSVLVDKDGHRYLCLCYDTRGAQRWIVTPISNKKLVALLKNEITLAKPFLLPISRIVEVKMDYKTQQEEFVMRASDEVSRKNIPAEGEYLDPEPDEWEMYIERLSQAESEYDVSRAKKRIIVKMLPQISFVAQVAADQVWMKNMEKLCRTCMIGA